MDPDASDLQLARGGGIYMATAVEVVEEVSSAGKGKGMEWKVKKEKEARGSEYKWM